MVYSRQLLRRSNPLRKNLLSEKRRVLRELQQNEEIDMLPAGRGKARVVVNLEDYNNKIDILLQEHVPIDTDQMTYPEKATKTKIK